MDNLNSLNKIHFLSECPTCISYLSCCNCNCKINDNNRSNSFCKYVNSQKKNVTYYKSENNLNTQDYKSTIQKLKNEKK